MISNGSKGKTNCRNQIELEKKQNIPNPNRARKKVRFTFLFGIYLVGYIYYLLYFLNILQPNEAIFHGRMVKFPDEHISVHYFVSNRIKSLCMLTILICCNIKFI